MRKQIARRLLLLLQIPMLFLLGIGVAVGFPGLAAKPPESVVQQTVPREYSLLQQGIDRYQTEQFAAALIVWQQALNEFTQTGDRLYVALLHSNLSLCYQQLGQWDQAEQSLQQSFAQLPTLEDELESPLYWDVLARVHNTQGRLHWSQGEPQAALSAWQQATTAYERSGDATGIIIGLLNQANVLQSIGLSIQAEQQLQTVQTQLQVEPSAELRATGLRNLAVAQRRIGKLEEALASLNQSLAIAQSANLPSLSAHALLELGNTERLTAETRRAIGQIADAQTHQAASLGYYQQAATTASSSILKLQAQINAFGLLVDTADWTSAIAAIPPIQSTDAAIPANQVNRMVLFARLNFAKHLTRLNHQAPQSHNPAITVPDWQAIARSLADTIQQARQLQDPIVESYALGQLGGLYEQTTQWAQAEQLTRQALMQAERLQSTDVRYRWEWQLGRLRQKQGDRSGAIAAYLAAYESLKSIRGDLLSIDANVQFSFRDAVEPVHRQLVDLLLSSDGDRPSNPSQVEQAIEVIDSLQLAELENFLRCNFVQVSLQGKSIVLSELIDQLDPAAALIYPILLEKRLEVIVKLPGQTPTHHAIAVSQETVEQVVAELQQSLLRRTQPEITLKNAGQLYDWLIRPIAQELAPETVKTLVFILDGDLRNIPMAVLHDGEHYLVEQPYALAIVPSLQLFDLRSPRRDRLTVLAAGVSEEQLLERRRFAALPNVPTELQAISQTVQTSQLLDQAFNREAFEKTVKSREFSTVHIATHGKFSSDPQETYIAVYGELLRSNDLNQLLRTEMSDRSESVDLLVLSACETARGDNRATLGLAGLAVRAGALSTLSTLWQISDRSTALMMQAFYTELTKPNVTKAEALHHAQLTLLQQYGYASPFIWAPYVLVGNWL